MSAPRGLDFRLIPRVHGVSLPIAPLSGKARDRAGVGATPTTATGSTWYVSVPLADARMLLAEAQTHADERR